MTTPSPDTSHLREIGRGRLTLSVPLTSQERLQAGDDLAVLEGSLEEETAIRKMLAARLGRKIKTMEAERSRLARVLRDQEEERPVDVRIEADLVEGVARYFRLDGDGDVVKARPLTADERDDLNQADLPLKAPPAGLTVVKDTDDDGQDTDDLEDVLDLNAAVEAALDTDDYNDALVWLGLADSVEATEAAELYEGSHRNRTVVFRACHLIRVLVRQGA